MADSIGDRELSRIDWSAPDICAEDFYSLKACFDFRWISQGAQVESFESLVAEAAGRNFCVAVSSGSSALLAVLLALDVSGGDEVVVPALSFIAVPASVSLLGAVPVTADVEMGTGTLSASTVFACLSSRTKAVIAIDYSGYASDWSELEKLCGERGVVLIADCACSFLATTNGRPAGSQGVAATFSFHAAKSITTGEGGAIVTDDPRFAERLRRVRNHGEVADVKYHYNVLGSNFRMTDIAASLGLSQLRRRAQILSKRRQIISAYLQDEELRGLALGTYSMANMASNGFTFTVVTAHRDQLQVALGNHGIGTRVMWPLCVHEQGVFRSRPVKLVRETRQALALSRSLLSLPVHTALSEAEVRRVTMVFAESLRGIREARNHAG